MSAFCIILNSSTVISSALSMILETTSLFLAITSTNCFFKAVLVSSDKSFFANCFSIINIALSVSLKTAESSGLMKGDITCLKATGDFIIPDITNPLKAASSTPSSILIFLPIIISAKFSPTFAKISLVDSLPISYRPLPTFSGLNILFIPFFQPSFLVRVRSVPVFFSKPSVTFSVPYSTKPVNADAKYISAIEYFPPCLFSSSSCSYFPPAADVARI